MLHQRKKEKDVLPPGDMLLTEGIFCLYDKDIRDNLCDVKLYVDTDDDERLARRIERDVSERGRSVQGVLDQ